MNDGIRFIFRKQSEKDYFVANNWTVEKKKERRTFVLELKGPVPKEWVKYTITEEERLEQKLLKCLDFILKNSLDYGVESPSKGNAYLYVNDEKFSKFFKSLRHGKEFL